MKNLCKHSPNTVRFQCPTAGHAVCYIIGNCMGILNLRERSPFSTDNLLQWSHGTEILRSVILACHGIKRHMCFLEYILHSHIATRPLPLPCSHSFAQAAILDLPTRMPSSHPCWATSHPSFKDASSPSSKSPSPCRVC